MSILIKTPYDPVARGEAKPPEFVVKSAPVDSVMFIACHEGYYAFDSIQAAKDYVKANPIKKTHESGECKL